MLELLELLFKELFLMELILSIILSFKKTNVLSEGLLKESK